jgi:hypothetical protein
MRRIVPTASFVAALVVAACNRSSNLRSWWNRGIADVPGASCVAWTVPERNCPVDHIQLRGMAPIATNLP